MFGAVSKAQVIGEHRTLSLSKGRGEARLSIPLLFLENFHVPSGGCGSPLYISTVTACPEGVAVSVI